VRLRILLVVLLWVCPPAAAEPVERAWLGVWLSEAVDGGVQIVALAPDGPARRAGLIRGDIVLEVDGQAVDREEIVGRSLRARRPGDPLELTVLRGGKPIMVRVELGRRPAVSVTAAPVVPEPPEARWRVRSEPAPAPAPTLLVAPFGFQAVSVTPALRAYFGAPEESGVLVTRVEPGRLAERVGLQVGDVLLSVDETEITDAESLRVALTSWDRREPLRARIVRSGRPQVLRVAAPELAQEPSPEEAWRAAVQQAQKEQHDREQAVMERRLLLEIERLERRIEELKRNLDRLREKR